MEDVAARAKVLVEALPYIRRWAGTTMVVKYGGAAMVDERCKESLARDLVLLQHVGIRPVVVHGGGPMISDLMKRLGKEPVFVDGQRVTDEETIEIVQMVLVGVVSQDLVRHIYNAGGKAVSVSGKDGCTILAKRKVHGDADLGFVGEIVRIDPRLLNELAESGYLVVVSSIGMGEDGQSYNINADTAAGAIAAALQAEKLIILSDVPGLLRNPEDPSTLVSRLTVAEARLMLERGEVSGGMRPKLEACVHAVSEGVPRAHLLDGRMPHAMLMELFTDEGVGTMIER